MAAASGGSGSDPGTSRGRPAPPSAPHRFVPTATGAWCDLCCRFVVSQGLRCADCKYTCHAHCRDLVHLGCRRNGKLMDCLTAHGTLHGSDSDGQVAKKLRNR